MRFGVVVFPGSNCDHDAWYAVSQNLGHPAEFIWHDSTSLGNIDAPTKISGIRIFENDVLSLLVRNNAIVPGGELIGGLLGGYFYPRTWDDQFDAGDSQNDW